MSKFGFRQTHQDRLDLPFPCRYRGDVFAPDNRRERLNYATAPFPSSFFEKKGPGQKLPGALLSTDAFTGGSAFFTKSEGG